MRNDTTVENHLAIIKKLPLLKGKRFSVTELKGGITNANYKIRTGKKTCVARFAPKDTAILGVSKTHEVKNCAIAERLGVGPKPVKFYPEHNLLLLEYVSGQVLNKKLIRKKSSIIKLARLLKTIHEGPRFKNYVDLFDQARQYFSTAKRLGARMPGNSAYLISSIDILERKLENKSWFKPTHMDLMITNVVQTKTGLQLIDWEYSANADCRFDVAFLSFKASYTSAQDALLLKSYGSKRFSVPQLELMKCFVALHQAGWYLIETKLSKIKFDYKKYAIMHLNRFNKMAKRLSL